MTSGLAPPGEGRAALVSLLLRPTTFTSCFFNGTRKSLLCICTSCNLSVLLLINPSPPISVCPLRLYLETRHAHQTYSNLIRSIPITPKEERSFLIFRSFISASISSSAPLLLSHTTLISLTLLSNVTLYYISYNSFPACYQIRI